MASGRDQTHTLVFMRIVSEIYPGDVDGETGESRACTTDAARGFRKSSIVRRGLRFDSSDS
jgi:hypothetical protein